MFSGNGMTHCIAQVFVILFVLQLEDVGSDGGERGGRGLCWQGFLRHISILAFQRHNSITSY